MSRSRVTASSSGANDETKNIHSPNERRVRKEGGSRAATPHPLRLARTSRLPSIRVAWRLLWLGRATESDRVLQHGLAGPAAHLNTHQQASHVRYFHSTETDPLLGASDSDLGLAAATALTGLLVTSLVVLDEPPECVRRRLGERVSVWLAPSDTARLPVRVALSGEGRSCASETTHDHALRHHTFTTVQ